MNLGQKIYFSIQVHLSFHFINVIEAYTTVYCKILKFIQYSINVHIHREIHEVYHIASPNKFVYSYKSRPICHILPFPHNFRLPFLNINIIFKYLCLHMMGTSMVVILSLCQFLLFLQFGLQQKITGMSSLQSNSSYAHLVFSYTKVKIIQCFNNLESNSMGDIRKI